MKHRTKFTRGDSVVIRSLVLDSAGSNPVAGATVTTRISGPENTSVTSGPSDASGIAETTGTPANPTRKATAGQQQEAIPQQLQM